MCGIFGIIIKNKTGTDFTDLHSATDDLLILSESRGKEAAGLMTNAGGAIHIYKEPIGASQFIRKGQYRNLLSTIAGQPIPLAIIGHARLATNGLQTQNRNNQPVVTENTIGVHNGIIVNDKKLWKLINKKPKNEVDTEVAFEMINYFVEKNYSYENAIEKTYRLMEGSATLAMMFADYPYVAITTNTGSLYFVSQEKNIVFASEEYIVETWMKRHRKIITANDHWTIRHLKAGTGMLISLSHNPIEFFRLNGNTAKSKTKPSYAPRTNVIDLSDLNAKAEKNVLLLYQNTNSLEKLKKHNFDYKTIYALRRCTRCILPETTPFITFNDHGVCNYCLEHKKIEYKGKSTLEKLVAPFRSRTDKPDSIIAFSGGRDSSYGLHFLKKELGLNPIAYTYDWGMVKDIARRNEARLVGKLGVEHVIISADITMKRDHIRKHILAWMKKPDLGMIPLFMEGDKQCEYYADKLAAQNNIKLIFFCRGNELEREEFKTGQCGVKNADPGGVIHNLSFSGKMQLASYYARQYIANPVYINSSLFDTAFAFFSTYVQQHDYIFLWHFIPWDENIIISTLKKNYNWETSPETIQTWRTDDGTSAFYNYIYYTSTLR